MTEKRRDPQNRTVLIVAICAAVLVVGCCCFAVLAIVVGRMIGGGSGGTCVVESPTGRAGWDHCYDGWTEAECAELSDSTYYGSNSCDALGFTKHCPGEGSTWRLPGYPCD